MADIIRCRGVTKIYRQGSVDVPALRGVDLDIESGDFATLAGPLGAGKTAPLRPLWGGLWAWGKTPLSSPIGGLAKPTAGAISVDGEPIAGMEKNRLADLRLHKI